MTAPALTFENKLDMINKKAKLLSSLSKLNVNDSSYNLIKTLTEKEISKIDKWCSQYDLEESLSNAI